MLEGPWGWRLAGRGTRNGSARRLERAFSEALHEIGYRSASFSHVLNVKQDSGGSWGWVSWPNRKRYRGERFTSKGRKYYFLEGLMQALHILRRITFADRWKRARLNFRHADTRCRKFAAAALASPEASKARARSDVHGTISLHSKYLTARPLIVVTWSTDFCFRRSTRAPS